MTTPDEINAQKTDAKKSGQRARSALSPALSIVIPAYNEERRLPDSLKSIQTFFGRFPADSIEIIVIIEKSTDRTYELACAVVAGDPRFQIIDNQVHRGKGYAVRSGVLRAQGEIIFFMDADLSTPLAEVLKFMAHFSDHPRTQVTIGSRAHAKSEIVKRQTWFRQTLGRGFNRIVQALGISGIEDTQCGFKAFRFEAAHAVFSRQTLNGFAFDVEALMIADRLGYKIDVRPVVWINSADSKVRVLIDPLKMLWDLIRVRRLVRRSLSAAPRAYASSSEV